MVETPGQYSFPLTLKAELCTQSEVQVFCRCHILEMNEA
jgi:hypothetical protein